MFPSFPCLSFVLPLSLVLRHDGRTKRARRSFSSAAGLLAFLGISRDHDERAGRGDGRGERASVPPPRRRRNNAANFRRKPLPSVITACQATNIYRFWLFTFHNCHSLSLLQGQQRWRRDHQHHRAVQVLRRRQQQLHLCSPEPKQRSDDDDSAGAEELLRRRHHVQGGPEARGSPCGGNNGNNPTGCGNALSWRREPSTEPSAAAPADAKTWTVAESTTAAAASCSSTPPPPSTAAAAAAPSSCASFPITPSSTTVKAAAAASPSRRGGHPQRLPLRERDERVQGGPVPLVLARLPRQAAKQQWQQSQSVTAQQVHRSQFRLRRPEAAARSAAAAELAPAARRPPVWRDGPQVLLGARVLRHEEKAPRPAALSRRKP